MKYLYILLTCLFVFSACEKDINFAEKEIKNTTDAIELSQKNQSVLNNFISSLAVKDIGGDPSLMNGMLKFETKESVEEYYKALKESRKEFNLSQEEDLAFDNISFPFDKLINEEMGFVSLRDHYDLITDYNSEELDLGIEDYIGTPILQHLLSDKKEIAIEDKIIKYMPMNLSVAIEELNEEALEDVRENGLGATHPMVKFYNSKGQSVPHLGPNGPGPDGPGPDGNQCNAYYRKNYTVGVGDDSNKVRLFARAYKTGCVDNHAVQYKVEWGDGTSSTFYGGYINHTYPVPNFITGDCQTFDIKLTITFVKDCWPCLKGKQWVNEFSVTLCPIDDVCTDEENENSQSKIFKTFQYGFDYRLLGEIGVDNSIFIPFNWDRKVWARSTFYKEDGNGWKKHTPSGELMARIHGKAHYSDECILPVDIDQEESKQAKSVYIEDDSSFTIYTHETGSDVLVSDHSVNHSNDYHEIVDLPLWP